MKLRATPITTHYLGHIAYIINRLGPMPGYSCRSMERTIGLYKSKKLSHSLAGSSFREYLKKKKIAHFCFNQPPIENLIQIRTAINYHVAIKELASNNNNNKIMFLGRHHSTIPPPITVSHLHAALTAYYERNGMVFSADGGFCLKYFGRMQSNQYIYYSQYHLSGALSRYSRSVSGCLVRINEK
jgi:hypothetical protein